MARGEFESEDPNMSAIINNCFIEIQPLGNVASYCLDKESGGVEKSWSVDLDWVPNYLGTLNDNLILLDKYNNNIVELDSKSGKEKNTFPLLWNSIQSVINNNLFSIIYTNLLKYIENKL